MTMDDKLIQEAKVYIGELFRGNSDGHDLNHSLRVYSNAMAIAKDEPGCDMEAVALAALLHDADDHKLFDTTDYSNAVFFLENHGVDEQRISSGQIHASSKNADVIKKIAQL